MAPCPLESIRTNFRVGFEMIDVIAEAEGISLSSIQFKAMLGKGRIGDSLVMLAKPQTFMNASGESMYDDLDLPFAKLRLLPKGGHGGHNGTGNSTFKLITKVTPLVQDAKRDEPLKRKP
ncbi:Peptidyl-tRNA hydrolase, mitochondrial [Ananas comosus]|uniref:Peptidyl-tRNA hydrolase, mitochondrial n=1 Tax=Ananas comosus TaxID=4615 RepID=A0A199VY57_ANACO|nr:Peptidyl-tRNA hydrolase, mitochondrial [Ananas comosus]